MLTLVWGGIAQATTYYVATNGSDSNNGTDETTPWLTVKKAVNTMVAGDTTLVRGGTYNETSGAIRFGVTGTQANPIKLLNYPGESPTIHCAAQASPNGILIQNFSGFQNAIGWITIEGFEIENCWDAIKWYNLHDSTIAKNWLHDNNQQGILGQGGTRILVTKNRINSNGPTGSPSSILEHGLYANGTFYTITENLFYDNWCFGIQQNGTKSWPHSSHPSEEFTVSTDWVIANNTFAHERNCAGIVVWRNSTSNTRIENNVFFQNNQDGGDEQGVRFLSVTSATGIQIRNNHCYATSPRPTTCINGNGAVEGVNYTQSGNVVNVSNPALVNATATLPASPDYRIASASSPVIGIARANEFLRNATATAGVFDTVANPTPVITANRIRLTFASATPIQTVSTAGVSVGCSGANCPGSPAVASVSKVPGTDAQVDVTISGIVGDACVSTNQTWTVSYASASGTWTASDNIGPAPGLHQKIFSFTNLAVDNQCTGTGPPSGPGTPYIQYAFDEGTGTTATNSGSFGASGNGTLQNGVTWANGGGVTMTAQSTQHVLIPYGSGVNPTTQSLTVAFTVDVPVGNELLSRSYFGSQLGTNQRFHVVTNSGTWTMGIGSFSGVASEFAVTSGPTHVCLTFNSSTDTATLNINGVASTTSGGLQTGVASYTLASNFELGRIATLTTGGGGTYRNFVLYQSVEDCADIYASTQVGGGTTGTFGQAAVQFEAVYLTELGGNPTILNAPSNAKKVMAGGAVAIVAQIHCENVADCEETAFQIAYRTNGSGPWLQVPNTPTADGFYMWGADNNNLLNSGITTTRLTGSCAVTNGTTLLTSSQIPSINLPQDGCVMLRWIVRVADTATGYAEFRVQREGGAAFAGTEVLARIDVIDPQAGGMGF